MEIRQLKHFLAIAESGSFTRGAEQSHVSQPAISASITKLEEELGCALFIRTKKQAALTPEGKRLRHSAEKMLDEYRYVKRSFSDQDEAISLAIAVASNFPVPKLSGLLANLSQQIPDLSYSITDTTPDRMISSLKEGEADLAFCVIYEGDALPSGWRAIRLEEERYGIAVTDEHPFRNLKRVSLQDLVHEPFIEISRWEYRNVVIERIKEEHIQLNVKHRTDQYYRALSLVEAGLGITIVPSGLAPATTRFIPLSDQGLNRYLTLLISPQATERLSGLGDFWSCLIRK